MKTSSLLLLTLLTLFALPGRVARSQTASSNEVFTTRVLVEGVERVQIVWGTRQSESGTTAAAVLSGRRGKVFVRRSAPEPGTVLNEVWIDTPPVVSFRREGNSVLLEAGGRSLKYFESDMDRATVRCWIKSLVMQMHPRLPEVAASVRVGTNWVTGKKLDETFLPLSILASVEESRPVPRNTYVFEDGNFSGDPWDRLKAEITSALGTR